MRQVKRRKFGIIKGFLHFLVVIIGAAAMTLAFFLVLPLMQTLTRPPANDMVVQSVDTAKLEAPPPPPEPEPEQEPEPEEQPPQLAEDAPPLDLSQLELAMNTGISGGWMEGDFAINFKAVASEQKDVDALFSIADLDQKPRVIYQPSPQITGQMRQKAPGTVYIVFVVDQRGRVVDPKVQKSSDIVFEKSALSAIKQWKFEPGKRNGKPVRFRMRVPITFPK